MSNSVRTSPGVAGNIALADLLLDRENPRIPEAHRGKGTGELAALLEMGFEAYSIAQSISELGFFNAEPLIVIPGPDGKYIVTEGNRRLTALFGLADPTIRADFTEPDKWEKLASVAQISIKDLVPVVIHETRETTHAEIARVHVVGKLPWRPYMQARFIAARVDEGKTIQEVADLIGITKSKAADLFRDQALLAQATKLGLETKQVEAAFSLLTVAMSSTKIRNHIGAPLGSRMKLDEDPIPAEKAPELEETIRWIFGDEEHEAVISDSRQIPQLGNIIASEVGLSALRSGKTMEEARQSIQDAGMDPLTSIMKRLTVSKRALESASDDIIAFSRESEVVKAFEDIESITESMRAALNDVLEGD